MVIRWALLSEHYQTYREWSEIVLSKSTQEVRIVRQALSKSDVKPVKEVIRFLSDSLANNLDSPMALRSVLKWANDSLDESGNEATANDAGELSRTLDALLGLAL
jgi:L-cysteine:1D-myo-inositol 2-amino-2-deoxy-alpha-D-glucopyranoside ligase